MARSKSNSRKSTGFLYDSNEKIINEVVDLGYGNSFHLFTSENLLQMAIFKNMVEFVYFYRDPKICFSPLRFSLLEWRKIDKICDTRYKKEKMKDQQDNLALFRRKHGVAD